jgi:hypothetical protein
VILSQLQLADTGAPVSSDSSLTILCDCARVQRRSDLAWLTCAVRSLRPDRCPMARFDAEQRCEGLWLNNAVGERLVAHGSFASPQMFGAAVAEHVLGDEFTDVMKCRPCSRHTREESPQRASVSSPAPAPQPSRPHRRGSWM